MKIKIDKEGYLFLERGGKMKEQQCPYANIYTPSSFGGDHDIYPYNSVDPKPCGDWCPLFDRDLKHDDIKDFDGILDMVGKKIFPLCNGTILVCRPEDFTDERGNE